GRGTYYDTRVVGKRLTRDGQFEVEVTEDTSQIRAQGEVGADLEARASRVYDLGGAAGIARLQHLIEPRVNYTAIQGVNQKGLPQFDTGGGVVNSTGLPQTDLGIDSIGKVSKLTYSLTNRMNAKTVATAGQEPVRWELARLTLSHAYNVLPDAEPFGDLQGDLAVQPNRIFRFRGDASYNLYGLGLRTLNTDMTAAIRDVSATVGTRFNDQEQIEFVRGEVKAKLSRYMEVSGGTNWDARSGTLVESRFGTDLRFSCWSLGLEYVNRAKNEDEFRFRLNLLGLGHVGR
ncbi:MAG: LPS assembly protein LptD, partial [Candidatus Rokubacteria bacterium]|nr:LPS assembly protein LptD [Candidatus Rokubacteria bacterium]